MVKLDVTVLRYLSKDEFRLLTSIEQGMKNHDLVPLPLIATIAKLKCGNAKKTIGILHKHKLIWHDSRNYDGYRLTYSGYDYLALKAMSSRNTLNAIGNKLGVGKESDIYLATNANGEEIVLKLHRLGRISFRNIKSKRDYLRHRKSASWIYMSRLAATKEYAFMKVLHQHGFPVPVPIDWSRHCVLMSRINGYLLAQVKELRHPGKVYNTLMNMIIRLAEYGLIHCDFNEFNLMINEEEEITLIDFPQMISTSHPNAEMYFDRDVHCIRTFFSKKFNFECETWPRFHEDTEKKYDLDIEVEASGFSREQSQELEKLQKESEQLEELCRGKYLEMDQEEQIENEDEEDSEGNNHINMEEDRANSDEDKIQKEYQKVNESETEKEIHTELNDKTERNETNEIALVDEETFDSLKDLPIQSEYIKARVKNQIRKRNKRITVKNIQKERSKRETQNSIKYSCYE